MKEDQDRAREKAEYILKVRAGLMTAKDAAKALGISRKTYYKWDRRGLEAMLDGLCERPSGRPPGPEDPEKETLKERVAELEKTIAVQKDLLELRAMLLDMNEDKKKP